MAQRKNDYRLTRQGKGISIAPRPDEIIATFDNLCPNCQETCTHEKIKRLTPLGNGKEAYQLRCTNCGFKRFDEFVDRSNYKSQSAKKGRVVQAFQEYLWDWLREHIEEVIFLEVPEKINIFKGRMGTPRRHKGKPVFSSNFLHPDFIRYLDTPEYIKILSTKLKELEKDDIEVFDFILFRGWGYSFPQMDDTGHFAPHKLCRHQKPKLGRPSRTSSDYCIALNRRATRFLVESIPDNLLDTFGTNNEIKTAVGVITGNARDAARNERVICPRCSGKDENCILCRQRKGKWDGTIPKWLQDKYLKKVANGKWKE